MGGEESVSLALANSIRRCILHHVQTPAIGKVQVLTNDGPVPSHTYVRNVQLIPVTNKRVTQGELRVTNSFPDAFLSVTTQNFTGHISFPHDFPVTTLYANKTLHMKVSTCTGEGWTHAKFSPVSVAMVKESKLKDAAPYIIMEPTGAVDPHDIARDAIAWLRDAVASLEIVSEQE